MDMFKGLPTVNTVEAITLRCNLHVVRKLQGAIAELLHLIWAQNTHGFVCITLKACPKWLGASREDGSTACLRALCREEWVDSSSMSLKLIIRGLVA